MQNPKICKIKLCILNNFGLTTKLDITDYFFLTNSRNIQNHIHLIIDFWLNLEVGIELEIKIYIKSEVDSNWY